MTILLSPDRIKAIVGECDDAQLERYQSVAREAVAGAMDYLNIHDHEICPPRDDCPVPADCRACWSDYLEREPQ
jgi:hypothetical protein